MDKEGIEILDFLRKENARRKKEIREDATTKTLPEPIVAYEKKPPNILHHHKEKPKSLNETWQDEDERERQRKEGE